MWSLNASWPLELGMNFFVNMPLATTSTRGVTKGEPPLGPFGRTFLCT